MAGVSEEDKQLARALYESFGTYRAEQHRHGQHLNPASGSSRLTPPPPYSVPPPPAATSGAPLAPTAGRKRRRNDSDDGERDRPPTTEHTATSGQFSREEDKRLALAILRDEMGMNSDEVEDGPVPAIEPLAMRFPNGAIRITRTPGRKGSAKSTVSMDELFVKESMLACWVHFFFVAPHFHKYLPIKGQGVHARRKVPVYIGKDMSQEQRLFISFVESNIARSRSTRGESLLSYQAKRKYTIPEHCAMAQGLDELYKDVFGENVTTCYPRANGCAHSKVAIVLYEGFARLVIMSANAMSWDMEYADNHYFIIDFPLLPLEKRGESTITGFEHDLLSHATELSCPDSFLRLFRGRYDFSKLEGIHLVTSVSRSTPFLTPLQQMNQMSRNYGLHRLSALAKAVTPKEVRKDVELEVCTASVGRLHGPEGEEWLREFFERVCGIKRKKKEGDEKLPRIKIVFPSKGNVESCGSLVRQGASVMGSHVWWGKASSALKSLFHEYHSLDPGHMMHQKFICALSREEPASHPYWIYIGSANFSRGAWGAVAKNGNLSCVNIECGVFVEGSQVGKLMEGEWDEVFTYKRPLERYEGEGTRPWTSPAFGGREEEEEVVVLD